MAALDFPGAPTLNQLFVGTNGVTYKWNGTVWVSTGSGGASITVSATPPGSPSDASLWYNSDASVGGGTMYLRYNDGNTTQWVPTSPAATPGSLIQTAFTETGAMATGTTVIPFDDTIPQITEGTEFMVCAITPKSATSRLVIDVMMQLTASSNVNAIYALFQDSALNSLAANAFNISGAGVAMPCSMRHVMTSGTTSATTFRMRAGPTTASTMTFNGTGGARTMGGVMASSIVIQEVA